MQHAAIYARYSTHLQRPASIEDQVRRATETAARLGYTVPEDLIFSDAAISGVSKAADKRVGWQALMRAWDERRFAAVFVDEISRIARDQLDLARIQQKIKESGVRLVTADGMDSISPQFPLVFGIAAAVAAYELEEIKHRVKRGMEGQLKRGYMIAACPYAYRSKRIELDDGKIAGTRWEIDEEKAEVVRSIFKDRLGGRSLLAIARRLNAEGHPTSRRSRRNPEEAGKWLPGTVYQLLSNTIYKGVMTWNGSSFARTRARKERRALSPVSYAFPDLRIVEDEVWEAANTRSGRAIANGGTRSVFSGLVTCGICDGTLCLSTGGSRDTFCCHNCSSRHQAGAQSGHPGYFTQQSLELAVARALREAFDDSAMQLFRARLRDRFTHGAREELDTINAALESVNLRCKNLLDALETVGKKDPGLSERYGRASSEQASLQMRRETVLRQCQLLSEELLTSHLTADPRPLFDKLFDGSLPPERVREMLALVCPEIVYLGKPKRFVHEFQVKIITGCAVSQVTGGEPVDKISTDHFIRVCGGPQRPTPWVVEVLPAPAGTYLSVGIKD